MKPRTVDFFTNFWGPKLICHTFLSFDFGPDGYVCISIETRMAQGQNYSALAGLYRQFALYYVIGDERARAADRDPAFSSRIREGLPGIRDAWITPWQFRHLPAQSP